MRNFIQFILAILTFAVIIWAGWQGYLLLKQQELGLLPGTRSVVIIFAILAIICVFVVSTAIGNHGTSVLKGHQFESRLNVYEHCLHAWQSVLQELPQDTQIKPNVHFKDINSQIALLASVKVLKAFQDLQQVAGIEGLHTPVSIAAFQKLVLAMREDLGQSPDWLARKEIQRMFK